MSTSKDPTHVAVGLKAAIHNPRVADEAKEHAKKKFEKTGVNMEDEEHQKRVLVRYKATLTNERTSEEAKEEARQTLEDVGVLEVVAQPEDQKFPRDEQ